MIEVLLLECVYDDGEHEPHTAEQCGIFADADAVRRYVEKRFPVENPEHPDRYHAVPYGDPDTLTWSLVDHQGRETDLVMICWRLPYYVTGEEEQK